MTELFYYSRFFGVKRAVVEADFGNALAVRVNETAQVVQKAEIDSRRADESGWWSSMDVWADRVVADAEKWATTLQSREDGIESEIAELRSKLAEDTLRGQSELNAARQWRSEYKFTLTEDPA